MLSFVSVVGLAVGSMFAPGGVSTAPAVSPQAVARHDGGVRVSRQPAGPHIVVRVKDGGAKPNQFCMPGWSIANETGSDVGDLLVQIEWRRRSSGEVLQPVGQFGTMVRAFKAGMTKEMFANGYQTSCQDLQMVVRTYACRDTKGVRRPCPGTMVVQPTGGVTVDASAMKEGPMKGAVEPRQQ